MHQPHNSWEILQPVVFEKAYEVQYDPILRVGDLGTGFPWGLGQCKRYHNCRSLRGYDAHNFALTAASDDYEAVRLVVSRLMGIVCCQLSSSRTLLAMEMLLWKNALGST